MDVIVSLLALITGTDDGEHELSLPECWQGGITNECVSTTPDGVRYMVNADDTVVLIHEV